MDKNYDNATKEMLLERIAYLEKLIRTMGSYNGANNTQASI